MTLKKNYYTLNARGSYYTLNSKGEFFVDNTFSSTWKLFGISLRWNSAPMSWKIIKKQLDAGKTVKGYVTDIDHGTKRFWGGSYFGKLPVAILYKKGTERQLY